MMMMIKWDCCCGDQDTGRELKKDCWRMKKIDSDLNTELQWNEIHEKLMSAENCLSGLS